MDNTQENETNKHSPNDCKEKFQKEISADVLLQMGVIKQQEDLKQSLTGQGLTRKAHWNGKEEV